MLMNFKMMNKYFKTDFSDASGIVLYFYKPF